MVNIKKIRENKCLQKCEEKGTFPHCQWECKSVVIMEKGMEIPQEIKNRTVCHIIQQSYCWIVTQNN
jgi:hypothetical protein